MRAIVINSEHPDYGVVSIPLPLPDEQYADCIELLNGLEIGDVMSGDCYMDQLLGGPPVLDMLEGMTVNIDKLDYLARSIDRFDAEELAKFQCVVTAHGTYDLPALINLSFCCVKTTVITSFSDLEQVGKNHYMTTHGGAAADVYAQLNGEGIARALITEEEGKVTPYGVLYENGMQIEQLYTGSSFPEYADRLCLVEVVCGAPEEGHVSFLLPQPEVRLKRML